MYNIAKAVGSFRPNQTEDVKLIQSLLKTLKQVGDPNLEGTGAITVTGVFTPTLGQTILTYQKKCVSNGATMVMDGVVDPLPSKSGLEGDWDKTYGSGAMSTLSVLCYRLFRKSPNLYFKIGEELNLPWKPDPFKE
jgi:hypothetical protein